MTTPHGPFARDVPGDSLDFSQALSRAVQRRGLTLRRVADHLQLAGRPVSVATLSYWQTGRSLPLRAGSEATVEALEKILQTPPGYLMGPLARLQGEQWDPSGAIPGTLDLTALQDLGLDLDRRTALLALHHTVHVDRGPAVVTTRVLTRSHATRMLRFALVLPSLGHVDGTAGGLLAGGRRAPRAEALLGCRVEAPVPLARDGIDDPTTWALPVRLPRSLAPGELAALEIRTIWPKQERTPCRLLQSLLEPLRLLTVATTARTSAAGGLTVSHHPVANRMPTSRHAVDGWQHTLEMAPAGLHTITWRP